MRRRGLLLCLLATPVLAQDQLIPKELVDGLLASRGIRQPVMFVGELPREMVGRIYVPKGARILGGMSIGSSGTAVLLSNARRETIVAELEAELPKLGWKQFDPSMRSVTFGEFRDAPLPPNQMRIAASGPQQFCGPNGGMTVNVEPSGFADTRITVTATDVNYCTQSNMIGTTINERPELALRPKLLNPPGARNDMTTCYRTSMDSFNSSYGGGTAVTTNMSLDALLDHYSKQLADSGWTTGREQRLSRTWTRPDSGGRRVQYSITLRTIAASPGCVRIESMFERQSR
jgi:hypothetical protein